MSDLTEQTLCELRDPFAVVTINREPRSNTLDFLTLRGFIILDHADRQPAFFEEVGAWVRDGRVQFRETVVEGGVEAAPQAFIDLLRGANTGKMVVKLS